MYVSCGNILRGQLQLAFVTQNLEIRTQANALVGTIHDRIPVILDPQDYQLWLDSATKEPRLLDPLLRPYPADRMLHRRASRTGAYDNELSRARLDRPPDHNLLRCHLHRT